MESVNLSDNSESGNELYMSAREAASMLGVNVTTLYSYVSRKKLRTMQVPGSRERHYWRADIERVRLGKGKRSESASLPDVTDLTLLTPKAPYYRGKNVIELAESYTLEQVASLLWQVEEDFAFADALPYVPSELQSMGNLLAHATSTDKAIALLPFLEQANPRAFDLSHGGMCRTGADVLRWYAAILTDADRPSSAPLHIQIARHLKASDEVADAIRRLLVLSADHGFGAGTHAVRAVASTGVTAYRSVLAGLIITSGRRSRLGQTERIWHFVREIGECADPRSVIVRLLRDGERVPGFDSPHPYVDIDPRALSMMDHIERIYGEHPLFLKVRSAAEVVKDALDLSPSFATANVLFGQLAGLDPQRVLYVLGRCAGWVAHSIEQVLLSETAVPQNRYSGKLPSL